MAASIESGVRVRLNFDDSCRYVCESALSRSFWYLVNLDRLKTIEGLALEICSRFDISSLRVELSLDGCLLPHWETTAILRENDLVTVGAVEKAVGKKRRNNGGDEERSNNGKDKKKKRRTFEEVEENDLSSIVAVPKEKKRRKEVKSTENVERAVAEGCDGTDGSKKKRRNRQKKDADVDLPDFRESNSVQSSSLVRSKSCRVNSAENLTDEPRRSLQLERTGTSGVNKSEQTDRSPFIAASASALVEDGSGFGKSVVVSNGVDEANRQLDVDGLIDEVKKKGKRIRRSRKNRKEKNRSLIDVDLKSSNLVFSRTPDFPSKDVQKRSFQWQKMDLPWATTSANSHRQHVVFDDNDDLVSGAPQKQNIFQDGVTNGRLNHNMAEGAETEEGLVDRKDDVPTTDSGGLSSHEPLRSCQTALHHPERQLPQLSETIGRSNTVSLLESAASVEERGSGCRPLIHTTTSDSRGSLPREQKPRQMRSAADLSPFANVQVFKRQRTSKFQLPSSTCEPALASQGNQFQAPTSTKYQIPQFVQDILDVTTSEVAKDYSVYELLLGPPRPGDVIAYKILQLSADYSPVLSSYKEAKVLRFTSATRIVELEPKNMQVQGQGKKSTGRFDLTIEDEKEILTNSLMQDDKLISISWDLLVEPRLIT